MASSKGRRRERTVCESCELPYYADGDGCPYCGSATTGGAPDPSTETASGEDDDFVYGDAASGADPTPDGDRADHDDGILARLRGALGL